MNRLVKLFSVLGIIIIGACSKDEQTSGPDYNITYDLHIAGGTIVDGSGEASFAGDILVSGDKIAYVGAVNASKIQANQTIDATGKVVSPGFIDAHSHGDPLQANNDLLRNFLRQGITTVVLGQDGTNPGYFPSDGPERDLGSFSKWIERVNQQGTGPNVATLVWTRHD